MAVAQRSTSVASISSGSGYYTVDRWNDYIGTAGTWTSSQEALTADEAYEDGFGTALKWDCTTANGSLSAGSYFMVEQKIEAQDLQLLKFGSSTSETLTLGFWVKATKTGTNVVRCYAPDSNRSCSQAYTVSSTDTWEFKVLNFPADTTGVIDNDNGDGLRITWGLAAGTNFTSGTLATTWATNANANDFVGQVNNADSTSNNFHITGVQLEVGTYTSSTLPPFQHESYGDNLARCQRYYTKIAEGASQPIHIGYVYNSTQASATILLPNPMRETPSIDQESGTSYYRFQADATNYAFDSFTFDYGTGNQVVAIRTTSISGLTGAQTGCFQATDASSYFAFDSEL